MDFSLTKEQEMLRKMAKEFAQRRVAPTAKEDDHNERFPQEIVKELGSLGLLGAMVPPEYGGAGMDYISYAMIIEEIAYSSPSVALSAFGAHSVTEEMLVSFGSQEQKGKYLGAMSRGDLLGCFGLDEPGVGAEASKVNTSAEFKEGKWVLNGNKVFVLNGGVAKLALVFAKTSKDTEKGVGAFLVDRDTAGFSSKETHERSGLYSANIADLYFKDCIIPEQNLLGSANQGVRIAQSLLDNVRLVVAAICVGASQACLDVSIEYAEQRRIFGRKESEFDMVQEMIADIVVGNEAARLLTYQAADLRNKGQSFNKQLAVARHFASKVAMEATSKAIQVHGAYGFGKDYPVERYFRDIAEINLYEDTPSVSSLAAARYAIGLPV